MTSSKKVLKCIQCNKECEKNECKRCEGELIFGTFGEKRITCLKCCGTCFLCKKTCCHNACMSGWIPDPNSIYKNTVLDYPVSICRICRNREEFFSVDLEKINNFCNINEEPKDAKKTITEKLEELEKRVAELENELGTTKKRRFN